LKTVKIVQKRSSREKLYIASTAASTAAAFAAAVIASMTS
jgi:hypothetical protein